MPKSVFSIQVRGSNIGGSYRCETEGEAQKLYDDLKESVNGKEEFFELQCQGQPQPSVSLKSPDL